VLVWERSEERERGKLRYQHCRNQPWEPWKKEEWNCARKVWEQNNAGTNRRNHPLGCSARPNRARRRSCRCCSSTHPWTSSQLVLLHSNSERVSERVSEWEIGYGGWLVRETVWWEWNTAATKPDFLSFFCFFLTVYIYINENSENVKFSSSPFVWAFDCGPSLLVQVQIFIHRSFLHDSLHSPLGAMKDPEYSFFLFFQFLILMLNTIIIHQLNYI